MNANEVKLITNTGAHLPLDGILVVDVSSGIPGAYVMASHWARTSMGSDPSSTQMDDSSIKDVFGNRRDG